MRKNITVPSQILLRILKVNHPIVQAPMAGGATTPELVAEVSNQGCLGSIGAGYLSADQLSSHIKKTQSLTKSAFSVNLFVPQESSINSSAILNMQKHLNQYRKKLGLNLKEEYVPIEDQSKKFQQQMDVVLSHDIPIFSFTFGIPQEKYMRALKDKGIIIIGTATNITEGKMLEAAGCDAIVAQGYEAGGHRGTFFSSSQSTKLGLMTFIPQLVDAVNIPVIAAGGIMDGRGVIASIALGAAGVQLGTSLLTCTESGISEAYKQALLTASGEQTQLTTVFSGKEARGVENDFMRELSKINEIPDYPIQHYLTTDIRAAATAQNYPNFLSLWAGQGVGGKQQSLESAQNILSKIKKSSIDVLNQLRDFKL